MYKYTDNTQSNFWDFNQPIGLRMNPENRWIKMADAIPWEVFEKKYSRLFKGKNGRVAKPLRLALGSLIIQTKYQYSDRELVEQLTENPYYQYFIGFPGYQEEPPIDASTLVLFRKRLKMDVMYQNKTHSVDNRIASIAQPWIRPIVRGKIKSPVEFGAKFDLSIDDNGLTFYIFMTAGTINTSIS